MTENWFTIFALLAWPAVGLVLFLVRPLNTAILWTILGDHLVLPVGTSIKLAMIPAFDKNSIASLTALAGCLIMGKRSNASSSGFRTEHVLIGLYIVVPFVGALLNGDSQTIGVVLLPGTDFYDGGSAALNSLITLSPFFIGLLFLNRTIDSFQILKALSVAGAVYSVLLVFEIRFSPQLHNWVYGYFPTDFNQTIRGDGYRPMAFLGHGLIAAFFMMTAAVAAATLWRLRHNIKSLPSSALTFYLAGVLVLCKSAGALLYGALLIPLTRFGGVRLQSRVAVFLVAIALLYPILRFTDLFPTSFIASTADSISEDRAKSITFRFDNEDRLLARAFERPIFGWGRFGRGRVYDAETGKDISVTDGRWIQTFGQFGLLGFIAEFGLLGFTVLAAASALKHASDSRTRICLSALMLIVSISIVDLLPNSTLRPWAWLLAGSLLGQARAMARERTIARTENMTALARVAHR